MHRHILTENQVFVLGILNQLQEKVTPELQYINKNT